MGAALQSPAAHLHQDPVLHCSGRFQYVVSVAAPPADLVRMCVTVLQPLRSAGSGLRLHCSLFNIADGCVSFADFVSGWVKMLGAMARLPCSSGSAPL